MKKMKTLFYSGLVLVLLMVICCTGILTQEIDFNDLKLGTVYKVGDSFKDSGINMAVDQFQLSDGTWTNSGSAVVTTEVCDWRDMNGNHISLNNANIKFDFSDIDTGLVVYFAHNGGAINIEINGEFMNINTFSELRGKTIAGVFFNCFNSCDANGMGSLKMIAEPKEKITSFSLGAQELCLDRLTEMTTGW